MPDVLRFFNIRPPQRADKEQLRDRMVLAYAPPSEETDFYRRLIAARSGERARMIAVADAFVDSPKFVHGLSDVASALSKLDDLLSHAQDRANSSEIKAWVKELTDTEVAALIHRGCRDWRYS